MALRSRHASRAAPSPPALDPREAAAMRHHAALIAAAIGCSAEPDSADLRRVYRRRPN
eukprot:gene7225-24331_t